MSRLNSVELNRHAAHCNPAVTVFKPNGGWTWFQDERVIVLGDRLVIGTAAGQSRGGSDAGDIDVTVHDLGTWQTEVFKLRERFQADDHDAPCFLVRPDGRLLAGYQSHPAKGMDGQDLMRWRISVRPLDPSAWVEERSLAAGGKVSYCHLVRLSAENDRIYSFFRGPDTRPHYMVSDDQGETFRHVGKLLSWKLDKSDVRYSGLDGYRPYVKYASLGHDTVHLIATEDHPRAWPNSLYHAVLRGGRLLHSDGRDIGPSGAGTDAPVHVDQLTRVFQGDEDNIAWPMDLHLDSYGFPVALFSVRKNDARHRRQPRSGGADHRYHYARWDGSRWIVAELCHGGSALYPGEEDFTGLAAVDPGQPNVVFASTDADPVTGQPLISTSDGNRHFEIFRGVTKDGGRLWQWSAVTAHSTCDNIRPVVPAWDGPRRAILWMRGTYRSFTDFDTDVVGFIERR